MLTVGRVRTGGYLDEAEFANDSLTAAQLVDIAGDLELIERGANTVSGVFWRLANDGHAGDALAFALANRERDDVDVETTEQ